MTFSLHKTFKYLLITIVTLIVLLAIAIGLIPTVVQYGVHAWLDHNKLDGQIEEIHLQIFKGRLAIRNFTVKQGQQSLLKIGSMVVRLDPGELFNQKIVLQEFLLRDFDIAVEQQQDQTILLAGLPLPSASAPTTQAVPTKVSSAPWQVLIQNIDLEQLRGCYRSHAEAAPELCASLKKLIWDGQFQLALQPDKSDLVNSLQANLSLELLSLQLKDNSNHRNLLALTRTELQGIQLQGLNSIKVDNINLGNIFAIQRQNNADFIPANYVMKTSAVSANAISISDQNTINISEIKLQGLGIALQRDNDGTMVLSKLLKPYQAYTSSSADKSDSAATSANGLAVTLARLSVLDDSSISFNDLAAKPVSKLGLNDITLTIEQIDSNAPDKRSPTSLALKIGQYGELHLTGSIALLAQRPTLDLEGNLKGIDLNNFNAYTQQAIQHYVKSGHLDAQLKIVMEQGKLDSTTQLTLHKFYVEPLTESEASQYQEQLGLPLGTALSLLRSRDDSINLKLPVSGDINAPDFSLNDVIGKVSGKAIKTAVINYYSPLGILNLAGTLFDLATALRFEPVVYGTSEAILDEGDKAQLDKIAIALTERPQLHLVICGVTSQADRLAWFPDVFETSANEEGEATTALPELDEKQKHRLDELASKRSLVVQDYLIKEKKIDASRLILCTPKHTPGDTQPPRTELQL